MDIFNNKLKANTNDIVIGFLEAMLEEAKDMYAKDSVKGMENLSLDELTIYCIDKDAVELANNFVSEFTSFGKMDLPEKDMGAYLFNSLYFNIEDMDWNKEQISVFYEYHDAVGRLKPRITLNLFDEVTVSLI